MIWVQILTQYSVGTGVAPIIYVGVFAPLTFPS
jgi:hypothetical protein